MEAVPTMAPGANITYIGAPNNYRDMDAIMNRVVDKHLAGAHPGAVRSDYVNGVDATDGHVYSARWFDADESLTIRVSACRLSAAGGACERHYGVGSAYRPPKMSLLPNVAGHCAGTFGAGSGVLVYSDAR